MDKASIRRTITGLGYRLTISNSGKRYVHASQDGLSSRRLGTLDELAAMSEEALRQHVKTRFALSRWERNTPAISRLTEQRMKVLHLVVKGMDNKAIAAVLGCEAGTAGKHVHDLLCLFGLDNRTQLAVHAVRAGIISEEYMNDTTTLTQDQRDLLRLVAQGLSNEQIGVRLGYPTMTVRQCLYSIQQRLGLPSRVQLAIYALKQGITALDEITLPTPQC